MANILLIEDHFESVMAVCSIIEQSQHELIGSATSLQKAQRFLSDIVTRDIEVDVMILDANLGDSNPDRSLSYTFPIDPSAQPIKRRFRKPIPPQPRHIEVRPERFNESNLGADGRMIKKFLDLCEVEVATIGFSSEPMSKLGIGVDYDLGKIYSDREATALLDAIDQVTEQ